MKRFLKGILAGTLVLSMTFCAAAMAEETEDAADDVANEVAEATEAAIEEEVGDEATSGDGYTIGFSPYTLTNEYFTAVLNGCQAACDDMGAELIYFDPQNDPTKQASQIDDMIASGIDALVYIPYDSAGAYTVLQTCRDAGVVVVNIDSVILEEDYDMVDGVIASDNEELGLLAGKWVAETHPDGANILIAHLQIAESCVINVDGFWEGIQEYADDPDAFVEIDVVEGGGDTNMTFDVVSDALQAHDDIDVIYCINDTSALGAVQAVEEAGKTGEIDIVGKDGAPTGKQAIADGTMVQSSAQLPTYMGYMGVKECIDILNGEDTVFEISIPSYSVDSSNIDEFDVTAWDSLDDPDLDFDADLAK